jgi:shikimate dehydrogenase
LRVVLLGHGIAYSASPAIQAAAFRAAGLDGWSYELADVPPSELAAAVESLRREGAAGANVTIPYKVAVMDLLDEVDARARGVGAVNTIVHTGSRLAGYNTDLDGIAAAAREVGFAGGDVVVLGAGGSARAVAAALPTASVTWVARAPARAAGLAPVLAWEDAAWRRAARGAALLVQATPLGRGGELPVEPEDIPAQGGVIDLVYVAGGTPLVRAARERGRPVADGWTVLVEQGAAAFELWTGRPASREAMRAAQPA